MRSNCSKCTGSKDAILRNGMRLVFELFTMRERRLVAAIASLRKVLYRSYRAELNRVAANSLHTIGIASKNVYVPGYWQRQAWRKEADNERATLRTLKTMHSALHIVFVIYYHSTGAFNIYSLKVFKKQQKTRAVQSCAKWCEYIQNLKFSQSTFLKRATFSFRIK